MSISKIYWGGKYYPVPYENGLAGEGFAAGKALSIQAMPDMDCSRFYVNIAKWCSGIALHFNPRFDEKCVVRNSHIDGKWGKEERQGAFPLKAGVIFDLEIKNELNAFQILIDGEEFCSYTHRLEPCELCTIQISGDVDILDIQLQ
ncbi:hypothetical protein PFISCL1PPCAC_22910 [Pristionchus fissidentatus]|uniref:Galectin n=1 Tax=Pristionchus fissidentatus TaxID=1538716 RepID=A0AAV5WLV8_9BILA|nr:hypothetical protein PFISCL1PPCAC_22910 [Pristionchus fissidentatus]